MSAEHVTVFDTPGTVIVEGLPGVMPAWGRRELVDPNEDLDLSWASTAPSRWREPTEKWWVAVTDYPAEWNVYRRAPLGQSLPYLPATYRWTHPAEGLTVTVTGRLRMTGSTGPVAPPKRTEWVTPLALFAKTMRDDSDRSILADLAANPDMTTPVQVQVTPKHFVFHIDNAQVTMSVLAKAIAGA
jgi:hypothetical protein